MIRIETMEIEDFRGIKKLQISLGRKNFGICGPNGTGKSGIVDAIEFGLTGDITRLGGSGTAELSVKAHAPHVDVRKNPQKSGVKIAAFSPALNKTVTIDRRVKTAASPDITPVDDKIRAILAQLATHPEFALSRREIVKYILTPAGQRSKDVQALLRLDQVEKTRLSLQKIANDTKKDVQQAVAEDDRAKREFLHHLGINALSKTEVIAAVNERRNLLQLEPIADLKPDTSLKAGVVAPADKAQPKQKITKAAAVGDITLFDERLAEAQSTKISKSRDEALGILKNLRADPDALQNFRRQVLVQQGLELLEEDACPLCDNAWNMKELQAHLEQKLAKAAEAAKVLQKLQQAIQPIADKLEDIRQSAKKLISNYKLAEAKLETTALASFSDACEKEQKILEAACEDPAFIDKVIAVVSADVGKLSAPALAELDAARAHANSLPDPSKEEEARDFLSVAQERYNRCRVTKGNNDHAAKRSVLASTVSEIYAVSSTAVLEKIYDAVENDFTEYYQIINHDDEGKFEGNLTPSPAKLALDVDFYGRGKFPPGAYHSEGHQDGMGLCLYLALMKHTLGDDFTFAVLDDVLMSVDAGHRREVCTLLKSKFSKTQFILTTHDPVWLQFMKTENLIQSSISFAGWTVDAGPQVWNDGDVWQQIAAHLTKNDVPAAAGTLRRYLEYISAVLADNFRASVEYHGNGQYDLGDLMPPVVRAWKSVIEVAKKAATSWSQDIKQIESFESGVKTKVAKSLAEQWMINKAVHYNAWTTLQKGEFESVATAFKELLESMQCPKCKDFLYISPHRGEKEALRCGCGGINFNLKHK